MKKASNKKLDHFEAEARLFKKKLNSLEKRLQNCVQSGHASTCMCPWNEEELKPVDVAPARRTLWSSTFFEQITPEAFKTDPALLSFDPTSVSLALDTPTDEKPKRTPTKCHQTQTEPFDFRTPSPRAAPEEQSVREEVQVAAEAPPVFISNGCPGKPDKPSKVARILSPPTRDEPQQKPKPVARAKFTPGLHKIKFKSAREATVPSPEEDLFKSSLPRYLVPRAKAATKTPSPPRKIKKPGISCERNINSSNCTKITSWDNNLSMPDSSKEQIQRPVGKLARERCHVSEFSTMT